MSLIPFFSIRIMLFIAGIDPGTTAGIALVDVNSKTKKWHTYSSKEMSVSSIVDYIAQQGKPVVVATDRKRAPAAVRKIAAAFGARLFWPKDDVTIQEKKKLVRGFAAQDNHERDALAAALLAKQFFATTLEKVEDSVEKDKQNKVKEMLLKDEAGNIESALKMMEPKLRTTKTKAKRKNGVDKENLKNQLEATRQRNRALEKKIAELEKKEKIIFRKTDSEAMKNIRKSITTLMRNKNETIRKLRGILEGEYEIVVVHGSGEMKGKTVLLHDPMEEKIKEIENSGAKAIITDAGFISTLPIIDKRNVNIEKVDKFLIAKIEINRKENFTTWLEEYRRRYEA